MGLEKREHYQLITESFCANFVTRESESSLPRTQRQYLLEHVVPCLVPAITALLKALEKNEMKKQQGQEILPIQPMNFLAQYLYRHNPKHTTPSEETKVLAEFSKRLLATKAQASRK